jgi:hypothetical protein
MNDLQKLRILLTHWIEHNQEHADEFRRWAEKGQEAKPKILKAAELMGDVNQALEQALEKLGGPPEQTHMHEHRHADGTVHSHAHSHRHPGKAHDHGHTTSELPDHDRDL